MERPISCRTFQARANAGLRPTRSAVLTSENVARSTRGVTRCSHDRECARAGRYFCTSRHHTQPKHHGEEECPLSPSRGRAHTQVHTNMGPAPSRSVTCPLLRPGMRHALMAERVTTCACTHRRGKSVLVLHLCRRAHARRCLCVPAVALRRLCSWSGVTPMPIDVGRA